LSQAQVNELVQRSDTPQALAFNLMQLMPGASESTFTANLDQALYAVYGYVTAQGGSDATTFISRSYSICRES
jgi:hypothetical protein